MVSSEPRRLTVLCKHDLVAGARSPVEFTVWEKNVQVEAVLDQWLEEDHSYYKLRAIYGCVYILRYDRLSALWELVFFSRPEFVNSETAATSSYLAGGRQAKLI